MIMTLISHFTTHKKCKKNQIQTAGTLNCNNLANTVKTRQLRKQKYSSLESVNVKSATETPLHGKLTHTGNKWLL